MTSHARAVAGVAGLLLALAPTVARGNGRPPATTSVHVRPGVPDDIYLAVTFGLLVSHDGGCSFRWVCEDNIGYGGTFDPKYEVATDGTIYAATFAGLRVSHDGGCSFETATADLPRGDANRFAELWVDAIDLGADGTAWVGTAETAGPNDVYRSTDGGHAWTAMGLATATIWWKSIVVAPSDGARVYVAGYELAHPDDGVPDPTAHLRRTDDGGATWNALPLTDVTTASTPVVKVAAIAPDDADTLWLRSVAAAAPNGDVLYRSTDGGNTWQEVLSPGAAIGDVLVQADGTVLAAVPGVGLMASTDGGVSFALQGVPPRLGCLAQADDGDLLACGANWDPDFQALGRSVDGEAWSKVFRFVEMAGPVTCPAGTVQHDVCEIEQWPSIERQFAVTGVSCGEPEVDGAPAVDARVDDDGGGGGCCQGGAGGAAAPAGLVVVGVGALRRRRARR